MMGMGDTVLLIETEESTGIDEIPDTHSPSYLSSIRSKYREYVKSRKTSEQKSVVRKVSPKDGIPYENKDISTICDHINDDVSFMTITTTTTGKTVPDANQDWTGAYILVATCLVLGAVAFALSVYFHHHHDHKFYTNGGP